MVPTAMDSLTTGGLAMVCKSNSALLQAHLIMNRIDSGTATDSGILVPSKTDPAPLHTSLVIPFNTLLWDTVGSLTAI